MAFCTKCGAQVPDGTAFCTSCGAAIAAAPAAPEQPAPAAAAPAPQPAPQPQFQQQQQYQQQYQQAYQQPQYQAVDIKDHTAEFDPKDISENKVFAMCCYLLSVLGVIIALLASSESKFARFHVRQALKIQVCEVLSAFLCIIPILGWIAFGIIEVILFVVTIISFFNAAGGKAKDAPIVGSLGFLK